MRISYLARDRQPRTPIDDDERSTAGRPYTSIANCNIQIRDVARGLSFRCNRPAGHEGDHIAATTPLGQFVSIRVWARWKPCRRQLRDPSV